VVVGEARCLVVPAARWYFVTRSSAHCCQERVLWRHEAQNAMLFPSPAKRLLGVALPFLARPEMNLPSIARLRDLRSSLPRMLHAVLPRPARMLALFRCFRSAKKA